ncbi:putative nucleoporin [Clavispora lusitaniae]|uniref:Nucleoporin Nup54 alpha-helical domain-containing protein n=2 Tax=Clavispora lusitaniae TaxID=36911 RepID=C4Y9X4_CLAL4|nr:uncharacterized protein CLUG_05195 [Clavispora lusitaniae ATCC 42720]KAF7580749.1 Nucleoporin complex subunit 54 family protein [Clavispora lusitaniae]EEQ41067.1 hypothetical protein CLUG_05195 [Clavispora lusitaniae ATCC 42720]QFZ29896.1 putative nucleoporin [Clavispora lusitaniae]QFZ35546.1 putative nucleoporin [Clavispora lusitaniae]QFZ41240.1 putative nucleoporin [Clavispora lusitaniae]
MFGATSGGTGMFGSTQNKPSAFGTQPSSGNGGFSFGSSNTTNTNNNAPAGNTGFSLGANTNSGGLFGNKPASTSNLASGTFGSSNSTGFGSNTGSNNLFGSANTGTNNNSNTGGLFGKPQGAANTTFGNTGNQTSTFGNSGNQASTFGSTNTNTQSGGLFGNTNTNNQASSGGLFGSKPAGTTSGLFGSTNNTTSAPSGGLFGSKPAGSTFGGSSGAPASGGLFGNTNTNTATNANTNTNASGGLFGSSNTGATGGLFGSSNAATGTSSGLFGGQSSNNNTTQPSFNWSGQKPANQAPGALNLSLSSQAPSQTQQTTSYTPAINDQVIKLKEQWDPSSGKCALKTHLYNKFTEEEINVLMQQPRPANESPEDWEQAMSKRPGPLYYPVKVSSFSEVAQRIEVQLDHVAKSRILLRNINDKMGQISSKHDLDNTTRIMQAKVKHTNLSRRLLRLATVLAMLKLKGYPLLPEEEEISKQFQTLLAKVSDPNGSVGKLNDIYARLAILKGRSEDLSSQLESSINNMNGGLNGLTRENTEAVGEGATQIDQVVDSLTKLLYKQQVGLNYVNEIVQKDLDIVNKATSKR